MILLHGQEFVGTCAKRGRTAEEVHTKKGMG